MDPVGDLGPALVEHQVVAHAGQDLGLEAVRGCDPAQLGGGEERSVPGRDGRGRLRAQQLALYTFEALDRDAMVLAKTASRSRLGLINEMADHMRYPYQVSDSIARLERFTSSRRRC